MNFSLLHDETTELELQKVTIESYEAIEPLLSAELFIWRSLKSFRWFQRDLKMNHQRSNHEWQVAFVQISLSWISFLRNRMSR